MSRIFGPIDQNPQQFKKGGLTLNLIYHHEPREALKSSHGNRKAPNVSRVFQVKVRACLLLGNHSCQRGLAALTGAKKGSDWMDAESALNLVDCPWALYHMFMISLKIGMSSADFQPITRSYQQPYTPSVLRGGQTSSFSKNE